VREVIEGAYRIIYRILLDRVDVVAVIHGARELPPT
jgi:plasmid stabilization system protein ParE